MNTTQHPIVQQILLGLSSDIESAIITLSGCFHVDGSCVVDEETLKMKVREAIWHLTGGQQGDHP